MMKTLSMGKRSRSYPTVGRSAPSLFVYLACFATVLSIGAWCEAKVFKRCELAQLLHRRHRLPLPEVATWVCIAQHSSGFNSSSYAGGLAGGSHGLFHISDVFWCAPPGKGFGCNLPCARLRDDDLTDDLACLRIIHAEHQRISGDGYNAWNAYAQFCRRDAKSYISGCFANERLPAASASTPRQQLAQHAPTSVAVHRQNSISDYTAQKRGKVYARCELAQELYYKHKLPMEQIPTWVCIAQHESNFNTAAVGRLNADGSEDHGLFQISDLYWCSHERHGGKACNLPCSRLLDNDIGDDVRCVRHIHDEHTLISGNGFNAWTVYNRNCRNQRYETVASCFKQKPPSYARPSSPNAIAPSKAHAHSQAPKQTRYQSNPFFKSPPHTQLTAFNHAHVHAHHTQSHAHTHAHAPHANAIHKPHKGKVFNRCELAQELYFKHKFPMQDIATWVCLAQYESNYDTSAVGRLNADGSADHGLFQISDLYWCSHDSFGGKGCGLPCHKLLDSDISDDVTCARTVHAEHSRISGNGFTAWTVYNRDCRDQQLERVADCFDSKEITKAQAIANTYVVQGGAGGGVVAKGKVYGRCELAQELYTKHKLPLAYIATWVCIAQHESNFDTAAVGRLNTDGSENHGLFQISDLYWCAHDSHGGKACNIPCSRLLDSDISDDVQCIKTIHEEHTRISGDGFTAWVMYDRNCRNQRLEHVSSCFDEKQLKEEVVVTPPTISSSSVSHVGTGKVYKKCELAQELYFKHKMPMVDIPTWVCIAQHESSYNTAAVGRLNTDGSADHGLFQISDLYWCSHDSHGGKACNIPCSKLLDTDITDDVRCVNIIYDEHTRISGDGFTAWTVYNRNCRNQKLEQVSACFESSEIAKAQQAASSVVHKTVVAQAPFISHVAKRIKPKGPLNHPFVANPFLNQFNATAKVVQKVSTLHAVHTATAVPQSPSETTVVPNYNTNPFLQKFTKTPHSAPHQKEASKVTHIVAVKPAVASFAVNPFLNQFPTGAAINRIPIDHSKEKQQQLPAHSPQQQQQQQYNANPFFSQFNMKTAHGVTASHAAPTASLGNNLPAKIPTSGAQQYQHNPFLHKIQSQPSVSKLTTAQQSPTKFTQTPLRTSTATTKPPSTRPYVNSDAFRTTQLAATVLKPTNTITAGTKKPTTGTTTTQLPSIFANPTATHRNPQTTYTNPPAKHTNSPTRTVTSHKTTPTTTKLPVTVKLTSTASTKATLPKTTTTKPTNKPTVFRTTTRNPQTSPTTKRTTTTTTSRKPNTHFDITTISPYLYKTTNKYHNNHIPITTTRPSITTTNRPTTKTTPVLRKPTSTTRSTTTTKKLSTITNWQDHKTLSTTNPKTTAIQTTGYKTTQFNTTTTRRPNTTTTTKRPSTTTITKRPNTTTSKQPSTTTTKRPSTTTSKQPSTTTTKRASTVTTTKRPNTTTTTTKRTFSTPRRPISGTTNAKNWHHTTTEITTQRPRTVTTTRNPFTRTKQESTKSTTKYITTTTKPLSTQSAIKYLPTTTKQPVTAYRLSTTTKKPTTTTSRSVTTTTTRRTTQTTKAAKTSTVKDSTTKQVTTAIAPKITAHTNRNTAKTVATTTRQPNRHTATTTTKPYNSNTKATTTTTKLQSSVVSIESFEKYKHDPFNHPFFAKYNAQFSLLFKSTTRKPNTQAYNSKRAFTNLAKNSTIIAVTTKPPPTTYSVSTNLTTLSVFDVHTKPKTKFNIPS